MKLVRNLGSGGKVHRPDCHLRGINIAEWTYALDKTEEEVIADLSAPDSVGLCWVCLNYMANEALKARLTNRRARKLGVTA